MFRTGAHHAKSLSTRGVPMCLSRSTLTGRATLPPAADVQVCDPGWTVSLYAYAKRELRRYRDEIGPWSRPVRRTRCESRT